MTVLRKRLWWCAATGMVMAAGVLEFLPSQAVYGLSSRDIIQMRHVVRVEIWRHLLPEWSFSNIRYLPRQFLRASRDRIEYADRWQNLTGQSTMTNGQFTTHPPDSWLICTTEGRMFLVKKELGHWRVTARD